MSGNHKELEKGELQLPRRMMFDHIRHPVHQLCEQIALVTVL